MQVTYVPGQLLPPELVPQRLLSYEELSAVCARLELHTALYAAMSVWPSALFALLSELCQPARRQ